MCKVSNDAATGKEMLLLVPGEGCEYQSGSQSVSPIFIGSVSQFRRINLLWICQQAFGFDHVQHDHVDEDVLYVALYGSGPLAGLTLIAHCR